MTQHVRTRRFERDWQALTTDQRGSFVAAFLNFDADLAGSQFRASLGVKPVQGAAQAMEMAWAPEGRATFEFAGGSSPHDQAVVWRCVGVPEGLSPSQAAG